MNEIMAQLTELNGVGAQLIWTSALVFLRIGAAMALLPAFGEQMVPLRVRLVVTLAFTAVVFPAVSARLPAMELGIGLPIIFEVSVGLMLGIGLRLFVLALQIAGAIAAQATSLSQLFGGATPEPQPALTNLLVITGLALAVLAGLHVKVAQLMIASYDLFQPADFMNGGDVVRWGLHQVATTFALAFCLAAPFSIAALLYNIAIGFINRAMPALMVSFVGAPALTAGGLALLAISAPTILMIWSAALQTFIENPLQISP